MAGQIDYLGPEGGRMAMAFGSGAVSAWLFALMIGTFLWKLIGKVRVDRIEELETALEDERISCRQMETRLLDRIKTLEALLFQYGPGPLRQAMQAALSEVRVDSDIPR